jgi:hypothetical protein
MALALVVGLVPVLAAPASATVTPTGFVASPNTAGSAAQYSVTVTTTVALNSPADTVSITFPSGFTVPTSISRYYISFGGQPLSSDPIVSSRTITFLVPDSDGVSSNGFTGWIAGTYTAVISQLAGILNPSVSVYRYRVSVATSQETTSANSNYIVIVRTISRSPSSGVRGTTTTVSGAGFASATTANVVRGISGTAGAASTATSLVDTGKNFVTLGVAVGNIVRDISDGSYMVVTSFATNTNPNDTLVSAGLTGGNANTWTSGDSYAVELSGPSLGRGLVGSDGAFTATVTATGTGFVAGSNTLVATDGSGRSATFTFTINPSATLSPAAGRPGDNISVAARDFAGATVASTTVAGVTVTMTPASPTITSGAANYTFAIPAGLAGTKNVVITDSSSNSVTVTLTQLGSPLTSSPATGVIGTRVTISGTGFTPNGTIAAGNIMFGGVAWNTAPVTIDSGGNFLVALTLSGAVEGTPASPGPAASGGTYTVTVLDSGGFSGAANFTVPVASITLSTASSVVGSSVVVRGVGFPANAVAIITYAGAPVGTGMVDSSGNFAAAISVPMSAVIPSTNTVAAYAITANAVQVPPVGTPAQATHSVPAAAVTLSAASGNPGGTITITGTGFPAYAVVSVLTIGGLPAMPSPAPATDGNGNVTANVIVPALPAGPAVVAVTVGTVTGSVAFTITTAVITPGVALAGIAGQYSRVWGFDSSTQTWKLYDPATPAISDLTVMTRGQGYWIKATQACTLVYGANQYTLVMGWNLIGWLD